MIYIRDDDAIGHSPSWDNSLGRFKQIHSWITSYPERFMHRPTIVVMDTQGMPEGLEFIKEETAAGRMDPQIHGLWHIDYGKLNKRTVCSHLEVCMEWFERVGLPEPTKWYTPWGASQPHLHEAALDLELELIDTSRINKLQGRHGIVQRMKDGESVDFLEGDEIFMHWWEGGARLQRVIEMARHGSWESAAKANRELFR